MLTSTRRSAPGEDAPEEDPSQLATHPNFTQGLLHIIDNASPGDLVYVHYSGHGIRRDADDIDPEGGDSISGTALALADVMQGGAYMTGYQLGVYIQRMVLEKKLRVTVVLDSCFSGQGLRAADDIDVGEYTSRLGCGQEGNVDLFYLQSDKDADAAAWDMEMDLAEAYGDTVEYGNGYCERNARPRQPLVRSWLSDPIGCTVLTACQSDEKAGEYSFDGEKRGILTYWMLKLLLGYSGACHPTYNKIRDYVAQKILGVMALEKQTPVLLGDADHTFLGQEQVFQRPLAHITEKRLDTVDLDIGSAQGVAIGAIYDVFPAEENVIMGSISSVRAQVTEISPTNPFRCRAKLQCDPEDCDAAERIKKGGVALLRTWCLHLDTFADISLLRLRLPKDQVERFESKIRQTAGLFLDSDPERPDDKECDFKIVLNDENFFEVHLLENEQYRVMPRVPGVQKDEEDWESKLAHVISQLARFQDIKSIKNDGADASLKSEWFSFSVEPSDEGYAVGEDLFSQNPEDPNAFRAQEDLGLRFSLKMRPECEYKSVYVSFYDFDASWGISKLHPGPGQFSEVTKDRSVEFPLAMMIPAPCTDRDPDEIVDTIRVFVSTSRTSWDEITLPELPADTSTIPPNIIIRPTEPEAMSSDVTNTETGTVERVTDAPQLYQDSPTNEYDDSIDSRNPKRQRRNPKKPPALPKNIWGFMDLKLTTFPSG
ncbi:hypothetical protein TWF718_009948 [Orbilia javanica]|uniref:Caspase domain-containing protein n=1 Tax=Orbilia javanica TaxID=47235 RepID=A0AAN8RG84_9PEZI